MLECGTQWKKNRMETEIQSPESKVQNEIRYQGGMIDKMTFEQRSEIKEDGGCLCIQRRSIPGSSWNTGAKDEGS